MSGAVSGTAQGKLEENNAAAAPHPAPPVPTHLCSALMIMRACGELSMRLSFCGRGTHRGAGRGTEHKVGQKVEDKRGAGMPRGVGVAS